MKKALGYVTLAVCALAFVFFIAGQASVSKATAALATTNGPPPKIQWSPCYNELGFPFECGTVKVPLDYGNPGFDTVSIALVRLPATNPAHKIGTLFFNPGGPGGSGVDFILSAGPYLYSDDVRAHFDIVGFDPRGIARSAPLRCFGNTKQWPVYPFAFPITPDQVVIQSNTDNALAGACDQRGSKLYDHMSTADAARDLDRLRQAVGDDMINYVGYSYGTYLGLTYINLFPDKVRAVVLDSNIDPIAWSVGEGNLSATLPFTTRLQSAAGDMETLNEFFRLCDEGDSPFKGQNPGDTAKKFKAMAARLKANPLVITTPEGYTYQFTYADLIANTMGALYDSSIWPSLADFLSGLEALLDPLELGARLYKLWDAEGFVAKSGVPHYYNWMEGFPAIGCADSDNPKNLAAWSTAAAAFPTQDGYFGPIWTWYSSICLPWGGSKAGRYIGPWNCVTSKPVLLVNDYFDPATRYANALLVQQLLPNSRLLSINGWGHVTIWRSAQADMAVSDYILCGTLPAVGTVYDQDYVPFKAQSMSVSGLGTSMAAKPRLTAMMVPDPVRYVVKANRKN